MIKTGIQFEEKAYSDYLALTKGIKFRFITFKIINEAQVVIDQIGGPELTLEDFKNALPVGDCRYALVYKDFEDKLSIPVRKFTKLYYVRWSPNDLDPKLKMLYALGTANIKEKLQGVHKEIQASAFDTIDEIQ